MLTPDASHPNPDQQQADQPGDLDFRIGAKLGACCEELAEAWRSALMPGGTIDSFADPFDRLATDLTAILATPSPASAAAEPIGRTIAHLQLPGPDVLANVLALIPSVIFGMLNDKERVALCHRAVDVMAGIASGYYAEAREIQLSAQTTLHTAILAETKEADEARYRRLIEALPDLVIAHADGEIVLANREAASILGVGAPEDLIGQQAFTYVHPDYIALHRERLARLSAGSLLEPVETQIRRVDGTTVAMELHTVLTDHDGKPTALVIGRDVTRRNEAQDALRKAHDELERRVHLRTAELAEANAALERSNAELRALREIGIAAARSRRLEGLLNTALEETLSLTKAHEVWVTLDSADEDGTIASFRVAGPHGAETAVDRALRSHLTKAAYAEGCAMAAPTMTSSVPLPLVAVGDSGPVAAVGLPIIVRQKTMGVLGLIVNGAAPDGEPANLGDRDLRFAETVARDISAAAERAHLARVAAEVDLLREMDHMRANMLANFTHGLKSPLGVIKFSSSTLLRDDVAFTDETTRELLSDIDTQADRLTAVVERILDLVHVRSEGFQIHKERVRIADVIGNVVSPIRKGLEKHRLFIDVQPTDLIANVDVKRIEEVLMNLVDNAVKYSPRGGDIHVAASESGGDVLISIRDRGIGIPTEDLERIFERFYRIRSELAPGVEGIGLGLPVCRGIVEAHGGRIWAESPNGKGTALYFTLPVA